MLKDCMTCFWGAPFYIGAGAADLNKRICKRMPPTPVPVNTPKGPATVSVFPVVEKGMCCGEHAAKHIEGTVADAGNG